MNKNTKMVVFALALMVVFFGSVLMIRSCINSFGDNAAEAVGEYSSAVATDRANIDATYEAIREKVANETPTPTPIKNLCAEVDWPLKAEEKDGKLIVNMMHIVFGDSCD